MSSLAGVLTIVRKEFQQARRDPAMLRLVFIVPLFQLLVLSYAATLDLKGVRLAVLDQDGTAASRRLTEAFFTADTFVRGPQAASPGALERLLASGSADATLWIPRGHAADLAAGRPAPLALTVDGTNSSSAGKTGGYGALVVQREAMQRLLERQARRPATSAPSPPLVTAETRFFYNPELASRPYIVPGIVVLLVTILSTMLTGMAVVREKEIGTLEQLMVTPLRPWQLIAGKLIPFAILTYVALTVATLVTLFWFRIPCEGSLWLLAFGMGVYLLVTLGGGLLASTVSNTQQQAMFTIWFFLTFGILMSGFFYPVTNMPPWAQLLTYANPMRYAMEIVRGIFLRGSGLADLWPQLAALLGLGAATLTVASLRFQKRLA